MGLENGDRVTFDENIEIVNNYNNARIFLRIDNVACTCNLDAFYIYTQLEMSRLVGKPTICICENKDADQLRGDREADQRLCFRYTDSTITLLSKSKISSF